MPTSVIQGFFPHGLPRLQGRTLPNAVQLPEQRTPAPVHGGHPLPALVRQRMETFFGAAFGDVRVHLDNAATSMGALAFTHGSHIHFAPGQYNPSTARGVEILAHELAHVVQQKSGRVRNPFGNGTAIVHDRTLEAEADRLAHQAVHRQNTVQPCMRHGIVQRAQQDDEEAKRLARAKRFAPELQSQKKEKEAKAQIVEDLKDRVRDLTREIKKVKVGATGSAYKHNYNNPIEIFEKLLPKVPWSEIEADYNDQTHELTVTLHMGGGNTVVGIYDSAANKVTVIHCGETTSGRGYGTNLGK
jgi:hypothetical protein